MNLIYLTSDVAGSKPRTLRAIRSVWAACDCPGSLDDAFRSYDDLIEDGEVLLCAADDAQAQTAQKHLADEGATCRVEQVENPEADEPREAEGLAGLLLRGVPEPSGKEPSFTAVKVSLILMHAAEGNPTFALSIARALGRITDDALWNGVEDAILETFPPVRIR